MVSPGFLKPAVKRVIAVFVFDNKCWRIIETELAGKLPPDVQKVVAIMREEVMATALPLCPVTQIVNSQNTVRPGHTNKHPCIDKQLFYMARAIKRPVNHHSVHTNAVTDKQREVR